MHARSHFRSGIGRASFASLKASREARLIIANAISAEHPEAIPIWFDTRLPRTCAVSATRPRCRRHNLEAAKGPAS